MQPDRSNETILYIVRHTDVHNPDEILYGRLPRFGLSDLGRRQAEVTAAVLAGVPVSAFYTSPMLRAKQTTRILASKHPGVPTRVSQWLNEVRTGWQGRTHEDLQKIRFDFYNEHRYPHDEGLDALWVRIRSFTRKVRRAHAGQNLVAVTHGDIFALARAGFRGLPIDIASIRLPHPYPGKGALLKLTFDKESEALPVLVEYFDPNGEDPRWSSGWVALEREDKAA
jgi:probable phosphoglycerate mutase